MIFECRFGVLIIPKWLIKVPGHIPILFGWFWELPKFSIFWTRSGPYLPVFLMNLLQKIQEKIREHPWKIWILDISTFGNSKISPFFGPINPPYFLYIIWRILLKNFVWLMGFSFFFCWNNSKSSIILTKWKIISKS